MSMRIFEDWSSSTVGQAPAGWTKRWNQTGVTAVIVADAEAPSGKTLRVTKTSNVRWGISCNAVDSDPTRAKFDVRALLRIPANPGDSLTHTYGGPMGRGAGATAAETLYVAMTQILASNYKSLKVNKYVAGAVTNLPTESPTDLLSPSYSYWIRLVGNGTSITMSIAAKDTPDTLLYSATQTDSSITAAGWLGVFTFFMATMDFLAIGIATDGEVAPTSEVVLDLISGSTSQTPTLNTGALVTEGVVDLAAGTTTQTPSSGTGGVTLPIVLESNYDRSSVNLSSSSVSGTGDSAVISIAPKVQESEVVSSQTRWLEPSVRLVGVGGKRPTLKFLNYAATPTAGTYHGAPWQTTRRPMFSYDRLTWHYFDTQTINTSDITFRHNTAFTSDVVYISRSRQVSVAQIGQWIESLSASFTSLIKIPSVASAFTPTLTTWPAQNYIADEYSAQTDSLGNTVPATPLYEFKIEDTTLSPSGGGAKKIAFLWGGVHAGEDHGDWNMIRIIEAICGSSDAAVRIRSEYVIYVLPCINAPGRHGGGWRGSWTQGLSGADDANRHATESNSTLEIVDKPKAVFLAEKAGMTLDLAMGLHGAFSNNWGFYWLAGQPDRELWRSTLASNSGFTVTDIADSSTEGYPAWFISIGARVSFDLEHGDAIPVTDENILTWSSAVTETIVDLMLAYPLVGSSTTLTASSSTASASQTHALVALGCTQTPASSTAAVSTSMTMGASTSSATAASSTGAISSTAQLSGAASTCTVTSASGALTQNQVTVAAATVSTPTSASGSLAPTHNTTGAATSASSSSSTAGITQTVNLTPQQTSQTPAASTAPISLIKTFIAAITVSTPDSGSGVVGIIGAGQLVGSPSATLPSSASGSISQIQQLVPGQCAVAVSSPQTSVTQNQILAAAYTAIYPFLSTGIWNGAIVPEPPLFARVVLSVSMHRRITFSVDLK